jgi:hypothetical protein
MPIHNLHFARATCRTRERSLLAQIGLNWPDQPTCTWSLGRSESRKLRAKAFPTDARIRKRIAAPSAPVHCARQSTRAHPTPSACAPTFSTTLRPAAAPSRARRARGRWSEGRERTCGKHTESSEKREQICRAQVQTGLELRIWCVYAPFSSSLTTFQSMVSAAQRVALGTQFCVPERPYLDW